MSGLDTPDGARKAASQELAVYADEKSDNSVVPEKLPNNELGSTEVMEERELAKGNSEQPSAYRTQGRTSALSGVLAVPQAAWRDRRAKFTRLLHHVTVELLHESFYNLKRDAASGVDGVSWREYEQGLLKKLKALHDNVHSGRYRAKPVRRAYIPKADGSERPLGVTALEDKIVQGAVVQMLNAIYEQNFLGLSYGFRPGRG
ncbi:hypothetical protein [Pseudomonas parafulva]|uniref:hypothetical protein n=1 Tax=Pseudomonas parafulva TaxID=157782 RepID=UPI0031F67E80